MRVLKLFSGLAGLAAVLISLPILAGGVALLVFAGTDDRVELPTVVVETDDTAVIAADFDVFTDDRWFYVPEFGDAEIDVTGERPLFVGVGPGREVRRFLADDERGRPGDQEFWTTVSEGSLAGLDWELEDGAWTLVVMNADGTPGVDGTVTATVPATPIRAAGVVVMVLGLGTAIIGIVLLAAAWGGRGATSHPAPAAA